MTHADGGKVKRYYIAQSGLAREVGNDGYTLDKGEVVLATDYVALEQQLDDQRVNYCAVLEQLDVVRKELEQAQGELNAWKAGRMADTSGHLFRCAKINEKWSCSNGCAIHRAEHAEARVKWLEEGKKWLSHSRTCWLNESRIIVGCDCGFDDWHEAWLAAEPSDEQGGMP